MGKLADRTRGDCDTSSIGSLPQELRDQLIAARTSGSHTTSEMIDWLHDDPDFDGAHAHITRNQLEYWFKRESIPAGLRRG